MRALIVIAAVAAMTACSDPVAEAQQQLELAKRVGSPQDRCRAARALSDAYLREHREIDYGLASVEADRECRGVDQSAA